MEKVEGWGLGEEGLGFGSRLGKGLEGEMWR